MAFKSSLLYRKIFGDTENEEFEPILLEKDIHGRNIRIELGKASDELRFLAGDHILEMPLYHLK